MAIQLLIDNPPQVLRFIPRLFLSGFSSGANWYGAGKIAGIVTWAGSPVARPVRVYARDSGELLRSGMSNASGVYQVDGLPMDQPLTVLSIDTAGEYNAVVADNVLAVL